MVLLAYTVSIFSFTTPLLILFILKPSLYASFIVWQGQDIKVEFQNRGAASEIASIIQTGLGFKRSNYHDKLNFTTLRAFTACKAQVQLLLIMIGSHQVRVDECIIETPLAFVGIGWIVQAVVIIRIIIAESRERTKKLCRAVRHAGLWLIWQELFQYFDKWRSKKKMWTEHRKRQQKS